MRSGQTFLRKLLTDLNTDCNHQGPQQGWTSSAGGCQLYSPPGNPDSGDGGQRADSRPRGEKDLQIRHSFLPRHTAAWTTGEEMGRSRVQYMHTNVVSSGRTGQEFSHYRTIAHAPDDIRHPSYFRWGKKHIHPKLTSPFVCLFYT